MKNLPFILTAFIFFFTAACEKESDILPEQPSFYSINIDTLLLTQPIDTFQILNSIWNYKTSWKNDVNVNNIYVDDSVIFYNYHSYNLFADDFGLFNFDFPDNQRENIYKKYYAYSDSLNFLNGVLYWYDFEDGDKEYKIFKINKDSLMIGYESLFHNNIKILLIKKGYVKM